ncbi:hypothetical protein HA466_0036920 [Hirschfeldia incana]|nr:hypothetical protein HA466_0036920 [Hirschfeldia incana]
MASLSLPHFLPHRRLRRNYFPADHWRHRCRCCLSSATNESSTAVVWFKHDLCVDDHPGLLSASKHRAVIPLYVLDRRILSRYTTDTLKLAIVALEELRSSLKKQGSDFMLSDMGMQRMSLKILSNRSELPLLSLWKKRWNTICARLWKLSRRKWITFRFLENHRGWLCGGTPVWPHYRETERWIFHIHKMHEDREET